MTIIYYADHALGQDDVIVLEKRKGNMRHQQVFPAENGISRRQLEAFNKYSDMELDRAIAMETERILEK